MVPSLFTFVLNFIFLFFLNNIDTAAVPVVRPLHSFLYVCQSTV